MILDSLQKHPTLSLVISDQAVEQVSIFKLLGVFVNDCLRWNDHVDSITAKVNKRRWFLKRLRRAGVSQNDLVYRVVVDLMKQSSDQCKSTQVQYGIQVLRLNKERLLKQSNVALVKSLLVVAHIQRTVQGLDWRT